MGRGVGFTREMGIEKFWRDSVIVSHLVVRNALLTDDSRASKGAIYEGTSNIQLQTIARIIQKEYF